MISADGVHIGLEAITRLVDAQAQVRAATLKLEASGLDRMILVLSDTRHNRQAIVDAAPTLLPAFPLPPRQALGSLRRGQCPEANGVILL